MSSPLVIASPPDTDPAVRRSRLFPEGTRLAYADLHNHTLLSDGEGEPERAFLSMRAAGVDIAALTDHARIGWGVLSRRAPCAQLPEPLERACRVVVGLDEAGWQRTGALADAADDPGSFTALRGFEWTHPLLGHLNVWFSERWVDPLHTSGFGFDGLAAELRRVPGAGETLHRILSRIPRDPGMRPVFDWLGLPPGHAGRGGGLDGLAGFNHPGREPGRFDDFRYHAAVADRVVSLELFNRYDEYLFDPGSPARSPLVDCLNAGWRVGLLGVSDEHGDDWGYPEGKGRGGLWVRELSREGVRDALLARRFFATNQRGLRLDAAAGGVRMGGTLPHRRGPVRFQVDLQREGDWEGRQLQAQVLRPGTHVPEVAHVEDFTVRPGSEPVLAFEVDLSVDDGPWVVLRIADPTRETDETGPPGHPGNHHGIAYASPWWLEPRRA